jgi:hypothetical protein
MEPPSIRYRKKKGLPNTMPTATFLSTLHADDPYAPLADKLNLYGRFVGDWTMRATLFPEPGKKLEAEGEIHFGWILEGRAVQDVWILPGFFHGTTLRVYDPAINAWHILWTEPFKQYYPSMIGRAEGADIVQEGKDMGGREIRWCFREITAGSFRWTGEKRCRDGHWFMDSDIAVSRR